MTGLEAVSAFAAGFAGGLVNAIAGGGTLATFPALMALGLDAKMANATSTVALWPASLAGAWGHRRHLDGAGTIIARLAVPSLVGGALGAMLLLHTPSVMFARVVPWLLLFATLLFGAQEAVARKLRSAQVEACPTTGWWAAAMLFQLGVGIYAGYFGAGAGILMLAALGLLGISDVHRANGVKNILGLCANGVAVLSFVVAGVVVWPVALMTAAGGAVGAGVSAAVALRLGRAYVRGTVIAIGIMMALDMLWRAWR